MKAKQWECESWLESNAWGRWYWWSWPPGTVELARQEKEACEWDPVEVAELMKKMSRMGPTGESEAETDRESEHYKRYKEYNSNYNILGP